MCWMDNKDSRKLSWMLALANGCLAAGLMLRQFVNPVGAVPRDVLHFVVGMLLGVSIAANFHVIWIRKRKRGNGLAG